MKWLGWFVEVPYAEKIPTGYGVADVRLYVNTTLCSPIPFNWVVIIALATWRFIKMPRALFFSRDDDKTVIEKLRRSNELLRDDQARRAELLRRGVAHTTALIAAGDELQRQLNVVRIERAELVVALTYAAEAGMSFDALNYLVRNPSSLVREGAVLGLAKCGDPRAQELLKQVAVDDKSPGVRFAAAGGTDD